MKLQWNKAFKYFLVSSFLLLLIFAPQFPAFAAASLSIEPLTWNVIGLDSNDVTSGPNHFPIGARVCNNGDAIAENVKSTFQWTSADPYINMRAGTLSTYTDDGISLNPGECTDFYYEVEVERNSSAYEHTRTYVITASADGGLAASTPANRELFVEYLISQSRNSVTDVQLDGASIAPGGTMTLMVGDTYAIKLVGSTATNGYNQLESFINFPNTIFQILSVESTYSVSSLGSPIDVLYADACGWENDTTDPNYMSCVVSDGKSGGSVTVTYVVKILQSGSGVAETLNTLLYDFSGSSFHYNSDFSVSARYVEIVDPSDVTIAKNFSPDPTNVGGTSKLTFLLSNPTGATITGANFTDTFPTTPGVMVVANPAGVTTSGCGSPNVTANPGAGSVSVSDAAIASHSNCTISLNVSVPVIGTYTNTTSTLKFLTGGGDEVDTGNSATDTLEVNNAPPPPAPICGVTLALWEMDPAEGTTVPPAPTLHTPAASAAVGTGVVSLIDTTGTPANSWLAYGFEKNFSLTDNDYFEFVIDTSDYTGIEMFFDAQAKTPPGPNTYYLYYRSGDTGGFTQIGIPGGLTTGWTPISQAFTGVTNTAGNTYFRIYAAGASNGNAGADLSIDNIRFTGCGTPGHVSMTKDFSPNPIQVNATSTLTFTLTNPNNIEINNVSFMDDLPSGVEVASTPAVSLSGCGTPTFSPTAGSSTLTFSGGTIAANGTCTVSVDVTATTAGPHINVSGFVSSSETGTNTNPDGYATADLTAILPPEISKFFGSTPIFENETSLLTFTITNPNQDDALTGVAFADTYPANVVNVNPLSPAVTNTCGGTVTAAAGGNSISLAGGSLAGGDSCTISVMVTSAAAGTYVNTSGNVSATNGGTGNTASAELKVITPQPGISMLKRVSTAASGPWAKFVSVTPGDPVYYQFLVENTGDVPLSPVVIDDPDIDTTGCTFTDPLPVGTPTVDPTSTCVIGPFSAAEGSHTNTAEADATYNESVTTSDPSAATYVGALPALSLVKEISTSAGGPWSSDITGVTPAADVYYRFTITNTGNVPLEMVYVSDPLVSTASCAFTQPLAAAGETNCVVGPITAETVVGVYTNTAVAHGTYEYDAMTYDSSPSSASYTLDSPDLIVTKTNDVSGTIIAGKPFHWTLKIENQGTTAAVFADGQTMVSDSLPVGPSYGTLAAGDFTNVTNSANISCGIAAGTLTCTASGANVTLEANGSFTVSFEVTPASAGDLNNTAVVDSNGNIIESLETNNSGSDTVSVTAASPTMTVTKTSTTTSITTAGQSVPYAYVVENTGNTTLTGVTLADDNIDTGTLACTPIQPATLAPGEKMECSATHTVTQDEMNAGGNVTNVATVDSDQTEAAQKTLNIPVAQGPSIGVAKQVTSVSQVNAAVYEVVYEILVQNYGNVTLNDIQVTDDLTATFGTSSFSVEDLTSTDFTVNPAYNGDADQSLLAGTDSLDVDSSGKITLTVRVEPVSTGPFENTAIGSGVTAAETKVTDESADGTDPDNTADCADCVNGNGNPTDNTKPTPVSFEPTLFDPPFGIKSFDDSGLPVLRWTMVWINDSNLVAIDAVVHDPIPSGTTYVASGTSSGYPVPAGAPADSTNIGVSCVPGAGSTTTTTTLCYYEGPTAENPLGQIIWAGTLGPDSGATDADSAVNEMVIAFNVSIPDQTNTAANAASIDVDLNNDGEIIPGDGETVVTSAQAAWTRVRVSALPETGFAPGTVTLLPPQPENKAYESLGDVWLEIPALGVRTAIVGVPAAQGEWDVSWLSSLAGWLHGTAFPSFEGNSVLTGHVYLANGKPGPFVNIHRLAWDDVVVVHAFGMKYIYHVRDVQAVSPDDLSPLGHEAYPWVTLITCQGYDEDQNGYALRIAVRAVLVDVTWDGYNSRIQ